MGRECVGIVKFATSGRPCFCPTYGLGFATFAKGLATAGDAKENVTIAVAAAQFTTIHSWQTFGAKPAHRDRAVKSTETGRAKSGSEQSGTDELFPRAAKAELLADIDELNAPVDSGGRVRAIAQLLLTHADRFERARIDIERIDQGIPDRLGAPLAQTHIVLAAADRIGVPDDEESITQQNRIVQRIRDSADRPI
jgi:hypothetical protein